MKIERKNFAMCQPWIKLSVLLLALGLACPALSFAARKKGYDLQNIFNSNTQLNIKFKNNNLGPNQAYQANQWMIPKAGIKIEPIKSEFTKLPKINFSFGKLTGPNTFSPIKPVFIPLRDKSLTGQAQLPKNNAAFTKLPQSNTLKPAFTQMPKLNASFTRLSALNAIKPIKPVFNKIPQANAGFTKLPAANVIKPAFTQLAKTNANFVKLPGLNTAKPVFSQIPKLNASFTQMPKPNSGFTQLPKLNASFTKLPGLNAIKPLKPAIAQMPKINASFTKLPNLPTTKPVFAQMPKSNARLTKLPDLKTMTPAFTQMPKLNANFIKPQNLNAIKPIRPVFASITPFRAGQSPFAKSLNNSFKFTSLPAPYVPKFVPYTFNVAKVNSMPLQRIEAAKPEFKFTPMPRINAPEFKFTALPAARMDRASFSPANLMVEATIAQSLEPALLVQGNKVKTLALLPVVAKNNPEIEAAAAITSGHTQALEGYISSVAIKAKATEALKTPVMAQENLLKVMQSLAESESLRVTQNYTNPAEKYLQSYLEMRLRE